MKSIIDFAARSTPLISFSGGEPLICKDLERAMKYAYNKGIILNLNTNGVLLSKGRAKRLAQFADYIRISIEGCGSSHDEVTGVSGSFRLAEAAIDNLKDCGNRKCKIGVNVVYDGDTKRLENVLERFSDSVDFISVLPRFSFTQDSSSGFQENDVAFKRVIDKYAKHISNKAFLDSYKATTGKMCDYGRLYQVVYPTGTVMGCPFITDDSYKDYFLGNINEESMEEINARIKEMYPPCQGCYATCTTLISETFNSNPLMLLKRIPSRIKEYLN